MDLVARCGQKADLHIHSYMSAHKDKEKVKDNTLSNLNILIEKLKENQVNICAITDHDVFNYELYQTLKKQETQSNCINKVFPGVEFSVFFKTKTKSKTIHIVTIFDDSDCKKVQKIEQILSLLKGKPKYDTNQAFTEEKYIAILKDIGLDTVMIAHQKSSLSSTQQAKKNDASTLGPEQLNEFLFTNYFEAYEFRNKKNELFNKHYIFSNKLENKMRMITGSDCHQWSVYPKEDETSKGDYSFTYIKCLPCFKGLVMAITDFRRIKYTRSFFNPSEIKLNTLDLKINEKHYSIPLSPGINVIIGDNSVGKSLLLHKINDYRKIRPRTIKSGYNKYLKEQRMEIHTTVSESDLFRFDAQGEIRKQFAEGELKASVFLADLFPTEISPKLYRNLVDEELQRFYDAIQIKFEFDQSTKQLLPFKLNCKEQIPQSITFIDNIKTHKDDELQSVLEMINEISNQLNLLKKKRILDPSDITEIEKMRFVLEKMNGKYSKRQQALQAENKKMNVVKSTLKSYRVEYARHNTDEQKVHSTFLVDVNSSIDNIVNTVIAKQKLIDYKFSLSQLVITPNEANVDQYKFISKLSIEEISSQYIENTIHKVLKTGKEITTNKISQENLRNTILYYPEDAITPLEALKKKISEALDKDFQPKHSIIKNNMDVYKELSDGFNAQIYFSLLTGVTSNKGMYIIDQPEDHISPIAIKNYLLDHFKTMGEMRQIIMVTHNPQFIVNLDVDNVIFMYLDETGSLQIVSGALEYEDANYKILEIVANNIEGGLPTIERRMKRYEKGISIKV